MNQDRIHYFGNELYSALRQRTMVSPLAEREPDITVDDAYRISLRMLDRRLADGERVVGKKIGVTSKAVMTMLCVHQPDFGFLTDRMRWTAPEIPAASLIQPRAEGEIAFVLSRALRGPGVTPEDVLAATAYVHTCFEIVDSRIKDWKIRIQDTVADNASCGLFLLGKDSVDPRKLDLAACETIVWKNGREISRGTSAAVMGSPLNSIAWLANTLGAYGIALEPGEVILSGSAVPLEPVHAGDELRTAISGIGEAAVRFV